MLQGEQQLILPRPGCQGAPEPTFLGAKNWGQSREVGPCCECEGEGGVRGPELGPAERTEREAQV